MGGGVMMTVVDYLTGTMEVPRFIMLGLTVIAMADAWRAFRS